MKLSDQALGAIMMALQKCLLEQKDIIPILKDLNFQVDEKENLSINNPPNFQIDNEFFKPEIIKTTGSD